MRNPSSTRSPLKARPVPCHFVSRAFVSIDLLSLGALFGLLAALAIPACPFLFDRAAPSPSAKFSQALSAYHAQCHPSALGQRSEEKLMDLLLQDLLLALEAERLAKATMASIGSESSPPPAIEP